MRESHSVHPGQYLQLDIPKAFIDLLDLGDVDQHAGEDAGRAVNGAGVNAGHGLSAGEGVQRGAKPADAQTLDARLLRDFREMSRRQLITVADGLAPHSLAEQIIRIAGLSPAMPVNSVTATQRSALLNALKALPLHPKRPRGFEEAIITQGGVAVKEVNPSTMESKLMPGLHFIGEIIDADGYTGGFNLQIAWSTAYAAAQSF